MNIQFAFRFGNQYETPLLLQSIVMNLSMLTIVQLCVQVKNSKQIIRGKDKLFLGKQEPESHVRFDYSD